MTKELQEQIKKEIEINENHISNFPLETNTGTKKLKEKFHKKAIQERNEYINKELPKFKEYQKQTYLELDNYVKTIFPKEKTEQYQKSNQELEELLRIIPNTSDIVCLEIKLGLAHIYYNLSDKTNSSLSVINNSINEFLKIMKNAKLEITKEDFNYSPFVYKYMESFLENYNKDNFENRMQQSFKEVYWECPELIMHIKRNLIMIEKKYYQKLKEYSTELENKYLEEKKLTKDSIEKVYQQKTLELENIVDKDEFNNLQIFLGKTKNVDDYVEAAPLRVKSFNNLVIKDTYAELSEDEKKVFDLETINLKRDLIVLKEYYNYDSIIKDMVSRFKKKEESKTKYQAKEKEIETEEKNREKLYKEYLKANGIGFLARKNPTKALEIKTKIKEKINQLDKLYQELEDLEIDMNISKFLTEGSSIYDVLVTSLSSYNYIEKVLVEKFQEVDVDFNLANYVKRYIEFIYNPNADFLHKVTAILDYDIASVISEKYALLGINIPAEEVSRDSIDTAISSVSVVSLVNNIKKSSMTIEEMKLICDIKRIDYKVPEEIV